MKDYIKTLEGSSKDWRNFNFPKNLELKSKI
jgi:hypothetical protein